MKSINDIKCARTWFVEDIHDQVGLWIKAFRRKQPNVATVEVREVVPGSVIITRKELENLLAIAEPKSHPEFDFYERMRRVLHEQDN